MIFQAAQKPKAKKRSENFALRNLDLSMRNFGRDCMTRRNGKTSIREVESSQANYFVSELCVTTDRGWYCLMGRRAYIYEIICPPLFHLLHSIQSDVTAHEYFFTLRKTHIFNQPPTVTLMQKDHRCLGIAKGICINVYALTLICTPFSRFYRIAFQKKIKKKSYDYLWLLVKSMSLCPPCLSTMIRSNG
jgi:hypothetical protein